MKTKTRILEKVMSVVCFLIMLSGCSAIPPQMISETVDTLTKSDVKLPEINISKTEKAFPEVFWTDDDVRNLDLETTYPELTYIKIPDIVSLYLPQEFFKHTGNLRFKGIEDVQDKFYIKFNSTENDTEDYVGLQSSCDGNFVSLKIYNEENNLYDETLEIYNKTTIYSKKELIELFEEDITNTSDIEFEKDENETLWLMKYGQMQTWGYRYITYFMITGMRPDDTILKLEYTQEYGEIPFYKDIYNNISFSEDFIEITAIHENQ